MARLTKGGRALLDLLHADIAETRNFLKEARDFNRDRESDLSTDAIQDAENRIARLERRLNDDLEPMLERRADNARTPEAQIAALEAQIASLKAQSEAQTEALIHRIVALEAQRNGISLLKKEL